MYASSGVQIEQRRLASLATECLMPAANLLAGGSFVSSNQKSVSRQCEIPTAIDEDRAFIEFSADKARHGVGRFAVSFSMSEIVIFTRDSSSLADVAIDPMILDEGIEEGAENGGYTEEIYDADVYDLSLGSLIDVESFGVDVSGEVVVGHRTLEIDRFGNTVYRSYDILRFIDGELVGTFLTNNAALDDWNETEETDTEAYQPEDPDDGEEIDNEEIDDEMQADEEDEFHLQWDEDDIRKTRFIIHALGLMVGRR